MRSLTAVEQQKPRSRRLRKKLHVGEFQEFGCNVIFRFDAGCIAFEPALDHWLAFVESRDWAFGGGGHRHGDEVSGYLVAATQGSLTEADRQCIDDWLQTRSWVLTGQSGPLTDAWHGPWEDDTKETR